MAALSRTLQALWTGISHIANQRGEDNTENIYQRAPRANAISNARWMTISNSMCKIQCESYRTIFWLLGNEDETYRRLGCRR